MELLKYSCWLVGASGLIAAYGIYSFPAHVPFFVTLTIAGVSFVFMILGFIIGLYHSGARRFQPAARCGAPTKRRSMASASRSPRGGKTEAGGEEGREGMSDEERPAEGAGGEGSLVEQAGETTAADMVSGPEHTRPVGAGTEVKVGAPSEGTEKDGRG